MTVADVPAVLTEVLDILITLQLLVMTVKQSGVKTCPHVRRLTLQPFILMPLLKTAFSPAYKTSVTQKQHNCFLTVSCPQVILVRNYIRSRVKKDWLIGRFSHVRSADELSGRKLTPLDAETWGEILEAELDR